MSLGVSLIWQFASSYQGGSTLGGKGGLPVSPGSNAFIQFLGSKGRIGILNGFYTFVLSLRTGRPPADKSLISWCNTSMVVALVLLSTVQEVLKNHPIPSPSWSSLECIWFFFKNIYCVCMLACRHVFVCARVCVCTNMYVCGCAQIPHHTSFWWDQRLMLHISCLSLSLSALHILWDRTPTEFEIHCFW